MNLEEFLKTYVPIALSLIALGTIIYRSFTADGEAAMKALNEHKEKASARDAKASHDAIALERRLQRLEDALPHMPSKDDFHALTVAMTELKGVVQTLSAKVEASGDKVDSMDKYLRDTGK